MNYKFTALLIIMFIMLTLFAKPAYPKNEYLTTELILVALVV